MDNPDLPQPRRCGQHVAIDSGELSLSVRQPPKLMHAFSCLHGSPPAGGSSYWANICPLTRGRSYDDLVEIWRHTLTLRLLLLFRLNNPPSPLPPPSPASYPACTPHDLQLDVEATSGPKPHLYISPPHQTLPEPCLLKCLRDKTSQPTFRSHFLIFSRFTSPASTTCHTRPNSEFLSYCHLADHSSRVCNWGQETSLSIVHLIEGMSCSPLEQGLCFRNTH